jgi:hypothetical protein
MTTREPKTLGPRLTDWATYLVFVGAKLTWINAKPGFCLKPTKSMGENDVLQGRLMTTRKRKYAPIPLPATRQSEEAGDKSSLSPDVAPVEVSNLALPDHREGLEACQGSPRRSKAAEAEPRPNQALDAPVVLLDDVVEIFALPHASSAPEFAVSLHVYDCPWISGVLVDREGARVHDMRLHERPAKEPLRRHRISPSRQQKIDRLPAAVDRPIEIGPAPLHANIGFVHPPGAIAYPQMRADPFLKLLGIGLDGSNGRSSCGPPRHRGR